MGRSKYIGETLGMGRAINYGSSQLRALKTAVQAEECLIVMFVFSFSVFTRFSCAAQTLELKGKFRQSSKTLADHLNHP